MVPTQRRSHKCILKTELSKGGSVQFRAHSGETVLEYLITPERFRAIAMASKLKDMSPDTLEKFGFYGLDSAVMSCEVGLVVPRPIYVPAGLTADYCKIATLNTMLRLLTAGLPQSLKVVGRQFLWLKHKIAPHHGDLAWMHEIMAVMHDDSFDRLFAATGLSANAMQLFDDTLTQATKRTFLKMLNVS